MQIEPTWWISVIEVPIVAALFRMLYGLKQEIQDRIDRGDTRDSEAVNRARDELAEFKLEVARTYVPLRGRVKRLIMAAYSMWVESPPTSGPTTRRAWFGSSMPSLIGGWPRTERDFRR